MIIVCVYHVYSVRSREVAIITVCVLSINISQLIATLSLENVNYSNETQLV